MNMGRPPKNPSEDDVFTAEAPEVADAQPLPAMTQDTLLAIIASMQKQQAESNEAIKTLAAAIVEAGKPKEPLKTKKQLADEENERMFKENEKRTEANKKALIHYSQYTACDHIAGSNELSEQRDIAGRTSIAWHRNDVG